MTTPPNKATLMEDNYFNKLLENKDNKINSDLIKDIIEKGLSDTFLTHCTADAIMTVYGPGKDLPSLLVNCLLAQTYSRTIAEALNRYFPLTRSTLAEAMSLITSNFSARKLTDRTLTDVYKQLFEIADPKGTIIASSISKPYANIFITLSNSNIKKEAIRERNLDAMTFLLDKGYTPKGTYEILTISEIARNSTLFERVSKQPIDPNAFYTEEGQSLLGMLISQNTNNIMGELSPDALIEVIDDLINKGLNEEPLNESYLKQVNKLPRHGFEPSNNYMRILASQVNTTSSTVNYRSVTRYLFDNGYFLPAFTTRLSNPFSKRMMFSSTWVDNGFLAEWARYQGSLNPQDPSDSAKMDAIGLQNALLMLENHSDRVVSEAAFNSFKAAGLLNEHDLASARPRQVVINHLLQLPVVQQHKKEPIITPENILYFAVNNLMPSLVNRLIKDNHSTDRPCIHKGETVSTVIQLKKMTIVPIHDACSKAIQLPGRTLLSDLAKTLATENTHVRKSKKILDCLESLLRSTTVTGQPDGKGATLTHHLVWSGPTTTNMLMRHPALLELNAQNNNGSYPVHYINNHIWKREHTTSLLPLLKRCEAAGVDFFKNNNSGSNVASVIEVDYPEDIASQALAIMLSDVADAPVKKRRSVIL